MTPYEALSALVAAIAGWIAGAVWYAPFTFGPLWLRFTPTALEQIEHTSPRRLAFYALALLASSIQAFTLEVLLILCGRSDLGFTLALAGLVWLAFTASASLMDGVFRRRIAKDWLIDMGHRLLVLVTIALVLGLWPPA